MPRTGISGELLYRCKGSIGNYDKMNIGAFYAIKDWAFASIKTGITFVLNVGQMYLEFLYL